MLINSFKKPLQQLLPQIHVRGPRNPPPQPCQFVNDFDQAEPSIPPHHYEHQPMDSLLGSRSSTDDVYGTKFTDRPSTRMMPRIYSSHTDYIDSVTNETSSSSVIPMNHLLVVMTFCLVNRILHLIL
jgi:hypothetical protein